MKKVIYMALLATVLVVLGSCSSSKKVAYFQNIDVTDLAASRGLYDATIMPKDQLSITVVTTDPDAARPFNLTVSSAADGSSSSQQGGYLVDNNGDINFPIVGKIHVQGCTKTQCEDKIRDLILPYMAAGSSPLVTVRMSSYRVTVLGEVASPGVVPVTSEKMSILEAIAEAGDLTIYGKRENVMLIREDAMGEKSSHRLNLNDAGIINSPYYYLQQNDIVYVEPNSTKAKNSSIGSSTTLWFSVFGILTSVASLIINVVRW